MVRLVGNSIEKVQFGPYSHGVYSGYSYADYTLNHNKGKRPDYINFRGEANSGYRLLPTQDSVGSGAYYWEEAPTDPGNLNSTILRCYRIAPSNVNILVDLYWT